MPRAWMIRPGSHSDGEEVAIRDSKVFIGWDELGDLTDARTREAIEARLHARFPEESNYVIGNWTGQLHRFVNEVSQDDIVVLPRRAEGGYALGRITSDYRFDAQADPGLHNTREVDWRQPLIRDASFRPDLRSSLGSYQTVYELTRNDAARRLEALERGRPDPGYESELGPDPTSFADLAAQAPTTVTIRAIMSLVGQARRSTFGIQEAMNQLARHGLTVSDSLATGEIDGLVRVEARPAQPRLPIDSPEDAPPSGTAAAPAEPDAESTLQEHYFPLSQIRPTQFSATSVEADDTIKRARTLMLQHDFSQLLVSREGAPVGVVNWRSIANATINGHPVLVREAMFTVPVLYRATTPLVDVVDVIKRDGYIFVANDDEIIGIVTVSDLVERFAADRLPLMRLEEIERRLRDAVQARFTDEDVRRSRARANTIDDLTFGAYTHFFGTEDGTVWPRLPWTQIDKEIFDDALRFAVDTRNALSHYSNDPLPDDTMERLDGFLRILRSGRPAG